MLAELTWRQSLADGVAHVRRGLRLMECLRLRVQDVDFARGEITVRAGKGGKDRVTMLPRALVRRCASTWSARRRIHERDLADGWGAVELPDALERKYPSAPLEWGWQWVFPQERRWTDRAHGHQGRHHVHQTHRAARRHEAVRRAGDRQARDVSHPAPLVRHPPARDRLRHPHDPGAARSQGREHDHDLHPRAQRAATASEARWTCCEAASAAAGLALGR